MKTLWPKQFQTKTGRNDCPDSGDAGQCFDRSVMLRLPGEMPELLSHFAQLLLKKRQLSQMTVDGQTPLGHQWECSNLFFITRTPVSDHSGFLESMIEEKPFDSLLALPNPVNQLVSAAQ